MMVEVSDLSFSYRDGEEQALRGVNLKVKKGEYLAIIGPNASGKSTLALLLAGLLLPTNGEIRINGIHTGDEEQWYTLRRHVGIVFQNPDNQLVAPVVEEDVAFGPENLGLPPSLIRARVEEALDLVKMKEYRDYAPHLLSGGQKQRVAIAGVVAMRPQVLILDEPTSMLDPVGRREVLSTLQSLSQEGLTVIMSTHFLEEITPCHRVLVLDQGRKVLAGTPGEILQQVEELKTYSLEVPPIHQLMQNLSAHGVTFPLDILTVEDLVKALCRLL